jgi:hypothetical protein
MSTGLNYVEISDEVPPCKGGLRLAVMVAMLWTASAACDQNRSAHVAAPATIHWLSGEVSAALARARREHELVFLYWNARWCAPCNELDAGAFSRPAFRRKLLHFVPVYLDGDTPGAQKWGDTLHVSRYPTVAVLREDLTEVTRVAGGMNPSDYETVLDLVSSDNRPARAVLDSMSHLGQPLSREDCRRLAYNDWSSEDAFADPVEPIALERAAAACPRDAEVERARLIVAATYLSLPGGSPQGVRVPDVDISRLLDLTSGVLAKPNAAAGARDLLNSLGRSYFETARRFSPQHATELLKLWTRVTDAAARNPDLTDAQRISAVTQTLRAAKSLTPDHDISPELAAVARKTVAEYEAKTYSDASRAPVIEAIEQVLYLLNDRATLRALLEHEVRTAKYPYYCAQDLALIEEEEGHRDAAIALLQKAFADSRGTATRFEWGTTYVLGLIRMHPQDSDRIRNAVIAVLDELNGPDRLYMRTTRRLQRLDARLSEWNARGAHQTDIEAIRLHTAGICVRIPAFEAARNTCNTFLIDMTNTHSRVRI